nr:hypothetical protein RVX_1284 [Nitratidesulfovibrio sp. HK-II]
MWLAGYAGFTGHGSPPMVCARHRAARRMPWRAVAEHGRARPGYASLHVLSAQTRKA